MFSVIIKNKPCALTGIAQLVRHPPAKRKVAGSIPSQGSCLDYGPGPRLGDMQEATDQCFSYTSVVSLPLFLLPFPSLSKAKYVKSLTKKPNLVNWIFEKECLTVLICIL